jgi:hypothetical protein
MGRSSHHNGTKTEQATLPRSQVTALLSSPTEAAPPADARDELDLQFITL